MSVQGTNLVRVEPRGDQVTMDRNSSQELNRCHDSTCTTVQDLDPRSWSGANLPSRFENSVSSETSLGAALDSTDSWQFLPAGVGLLMAGLAFLTFGVIEAVRTTSTAYATWIEAPVVGGGLMLLGAYYLSKNRTPMRANVKMDSPDWA